jgi:multidrug efflux system membrane fusion protein
MASSTEGAGASSASGKSSKKLIWAVLAAGVLAIAVYFALRGTASEGASAGKKAAARVPVVASAAVSGDIGVYLTGLGSVTPLYTVNVHSRVDGQLMKVLFTEGQFVKEGDLLAEIDPRPFAVQADQMQGQLMRDEAQLKNARIDLERYKTLWAHDAIPQQTLSTQEAAVAQDEGVVKSDQAQIENAKLNLTYCHITAPIGGRVGLRQVDAGNMVHASDAGPLVTITQIKPITAVFTIPEDHLVPVLKKVLNGEPLQADAYDREQRVKLASGTLLTVDNQIDSTTGTVKCKAIFPNDDGLLFPNQFVNMRLLLEMKHGVTIVPTAAIQRGAQQSTFVYLVSSGGSKGGKGGGSQVVSIKKVELGTSEGDQVEIVSGVRPGEWVVLDGIDRLEDGSPVTVQTKESTAEPKSKALAKAGSDTAQRGTQ